MKVHVMYYSPQVSIHPKWNFNSTAFWEVVIDDICMGVITSQIYATKPTKRQIRKLKKIHRLS